MTCPPPNLRFFRSCLIEDEPAVMAYVCAALERSGYQVVSAESGAEGVQMLESGRFSGRGLGHA